MDSRNFFELVVRKHEVAELTPEQRQALTVQLMAVEDKLGQILQRYGIESQGEDVLLLTDTRFKKLQELADLPIDKPIKIHYDNRVMYAISPDGEGCYYYDTLAELKAEH